MSTAGAQSYFVIPLSVQKDGEDYLVGNAEIGDFYQFPEQGIKILDLLKSGLTAPVIQSRLQEDYQETVDVDGFVEQLASIGFIHPEAERQSVQQHLETSGQTSRRTFSVNPRIARAFFSAPAMTIYGAILLYATWSALADQRLRINFNAFYIENYRTPFLLLVLTLALIHVAFHELSHMLAAARHGIKSKYGIGNRLWMIVAESDLTGILTLPRSQRYFPMLAGLLADILWASLLTVLIKGLFVYGASPFAIQLVQALILDIVISMRWQFDIFVKTDIYFVICNFFRYPDLDRDARTYLANLVHRLTFGQYGNAAHTGFRNLNGVRVFSVIWLVGRVLSVLVLFGVFLPTMARYVISAAEMMTGPPVSVWIVADTIAYVVIMVSMIGTGMYVWLKQR